MVLLFPSVEISTPSPPFIPFPSFPFPSLPLYTECKVEKGNFTRNSSSFLTETRVTQTKTRVTTTKTHTRCSVICVFPDNYLRNRCNPLFYKHSPFRVMDVVTS
jgi:hypothetical protein